jgi:hypothetical protein
MDQQFKMAKQMIDMQKASVEGSINGMITMWEQTASLLESALWLPEEGKKAVRQWMDINKKACEDLRNAVASGYSNLEKFFAS